MTTLILVLSKEMINTAISWEETMSALKTLTSVATFATIVVVTKQDW